MHDCPSCFHDCDCDGWGSACYHLCAPTLDEAIGLFEAELIRRGYAIVRADDDHLTVLHPDGSVALTAVKK